MKDIFVSHTNDELIKLISKRTHILVEVISITDHGTVIIVDEYTNEHEYRIEDFDSRSYAIEDTLRSIVEEDYDNDIKDIPERLQYLIMDREECISMRIEDIKMDVDFSYTQFLSNYEVEIVIPKYDNSKSMYDNYYLYEI